MRTSSLSMIAVLFAVTPLLGQVDPAKLQQQSVRVIAGDKTGSGVVVVRGEEAFVWTAAHVVYRCQRVSKGIDPVTGQERHSIVYDDAEVIQDLTEGGRKVGELKWFAEVIRCSRGDHGGEDLALLRVYKRKSFAGGITFDLEAKPQPSGTRVWHVGSMLGVQGHNMLAEGVVATTGKLRKYGKSEELAQPKIFDGATLTAVGGSSGGGIFEQKSGKLIGLLTEGPTDTVNFYVPARRILAYAKHADCLWAVDPRVALPKGGWGKITDRPIPVE